MRDHTKLRAFELADELALATYGATQAPPSEERFGFTSQMRRAAVSLASKIIEGCARNTEADYLRFLDMAFGSCRELAYRLSPARRLECFSGEQATGVASLAEETSKVLGGLIRSIRHG